MKLLDPWLADQDREVQESPEAIFREAKRRQNRRRLAAGTSLVLAAGAVAVIAAAVASGAGTPPPHAAPSANIRPVGTSGFRWVQIATVSAPSVRIGAPMAYDPATRQLVLIGGIREVTPMIGSPVATSTILGDTWVFTRGNWTEMTSGRTPPTGAQPDVLAYDPARKELILVTSPTFVKGTTRLTARSTTWTWTGSHWSELLGDGPRWGTGAAGSVTYAGAALMAYDVATQQLVFSPSNGRRNSTTSTYVLGKSRWLREHKPPLLRWMAYDPVTRRLLGENGETGAMWWWTGKRWRLFTRHVVVHFKAGSIPGILVDGANWVTDQSADEIMAFGNFYASTTTSHAPYQRGELFTWLRGRWYPIDAPLHNTPSNIQFLSLAYDGSIGGVVAFGGGTGRMTGSRMWVSGGNGTWELVRSR
ncbi:MAG: hypothetical protein M0008_03470 [Actinomycetota bacterium]|jgi:hypothetical protein|nr:hypothetical protein [Actinomycetota bacterium]